jgi:hypothetical protein
MAIEYSASPSPPVDAGRLPEPMRDGRVEILRDFLCEIRTTAGASGIAECEAYLNDAMEAISKFPPDWQRVNSLIALATREMEIARGTSRPRDDRPELSRKD